MWKAFLGVVRKRCSLVVHVLDRFHVAKLLSEAIDTVRRDELRALRGSGRHVVLKNSRWVLLKNRATRTSKDRSRLPDLLGLNLRSVRACLLKEECQHFWTFKS